MSDRAPVVAARGVTRVLGGAVPATLVRDVDVEVAPGEFVAVTGPSGSGKSSLLYLLGLLDRPTRGRVLFDGVDTAGLGGDALAALRLARIGFVFQFHFLMLEFTALENVMMPMRKLGRLAPEDMRERAHGLLESVGLGAKTHRLGTQLSGGEQQRVAIARALANQPTILLADEPTGNLDVRNSNLVFDLLTRLAKENGQAVVLVTHNPEIAQRCDVTRPMRDGVFV